MTSHTAPLTAEQVEILRKKLQAEGYDFFPKEYTIFAAKGQGVTVAAYRKGPKVLVQGKGTADFVGKFLGGVNENGAAASVGSRSLKSDSLEPHFGIDESGKGDYFGPLVVAGVFTNREIAQHLAKIGVMDSKKVTTPEKIRELAAQIKATPGIHFDIIAMRPERYNEIYRGFGNLNRMLAWGHATVIEKLAELCPECPRALSDQFARKDVLESALKKKGLSLKLDQRTQGESDIAVAAASILARERFIDWMDAAGKKVGFTIPLGASNRVITTGKKLVDRYGKENLVKFAKLHFKTTQQIVDGLL